MRSVRRWQWRRGGTAALAVIAVLSMLLVPPGLHSEGTDEDLETALKLAALLRAGRIVISQHQELINDPSRAGKGLTGERVLDESMTVYQELTGENLHEIDPASEEGRLLQAQMDAIREVVDEHQDTINAEGMGFKGFIPAVFARLVNERFAAGMAHEALIKVTAPERLVRNRTARPDAWETAIINGRFAKDEWPRGEPYSEVVEIDGRTAFRVLLPEYYEASCLACHGEPAGEVDITGYPKEGGREGDLGAAISVTLFR